MVTAAARVIIDDQPARTGRSASRNSRGPLGRLVGPAYVVSGLFFFTPMIDIVTNVWPLSPGVLSWRYGATGAAANYLISIVFGALLGCCVAAISEHVRTLRAFGVTCLLTAALFGLAAAEFAMDVAQIRALVPPGENGIFLVGAAKAELKYLTSIVAMVLIGIASWRTASSVRARHMMG